jgi:hypothetical protein
MPIGEWQIQFAEEVDRQDLIGGYQIARPAAGLFCDIPGLSGWSTGNEAVDRENLKPKPRWHRLKGFHRRQMRVADRGSYFPFRN